MTDLVRKCRQKMSRQPSLFLSLLQVTNSSLEISMRPQRNFQNQQEHNSHVWILLNLEPFIDLPQNEQIRWLRIETRLCYWWFGIGRICRTLFLITSNRFGVNADSPTHSVVGPMQHSVRADCMSCLYFVSVDKSILFRFCIWP